MADKMKTSIAIDRDAHDWLAQKASGYRGIGGLVSTLVRERKTVDTVLTRLDGIERRLDMLLTK